MAEDVILKQPESPIINASRVPPAHPRAVFADHAHRQAGGCGGAVDDAGAFSLVSANPADRETGLARATRICRQPRRTADGGCGGAAAPQLRRRRPDARGIVPRRPPRRTLCRRARRVVGRHSGVHRRRVDSASLRRRLRIRGGRLTRTVPERSHLAFLAVVLYRPAPECVAAGPALSDRLGRHPPGGSGRPRNSETDARTPVRRSPALLPQPARPPGWPGS